MEWNKFQTQSNQKNLYKMKKISLLLLAADSGEGQFNWMADSVLKEQLEQNNIFFQESYFSQLEKNDLDCFDLVLLMRSPVPAHPKNDTDAFVEKCVWLQEFVENGGGLILMFTECYGKSVASLNEFAKNFDIQFAFNKILESNSDNLTHLPNMPEGLIVNAEFAPEIPFGNNRQKNKNLGIIFDGGHGTQAMTCISSKEWSPILTGFSSCISQPFPEGFYTGSVDEIFESPVFCASRNFKKGRVVAFPSSSALWIANPFLKRWEGILMKQNNDAGFDFIKEMIQWCAGNIVSDKVAPAENIFKNRSLIDPVEFSFRTVLDSEQATLKKLKPLKMWLGIPPKNTSSEQVVESAVENDYNIVVIIHDYDLLNENKWRDLKAEYAKLAEQYGLVIEPAFEQLDDEGNVCVVFNVDELPEMRSKYPNSNMLEDLLVKLNGYTAIYAKPEENRIPAWRHGGYTMLEINSQNDVELFHDRVSSCGFISGIAIARNSMPGDEEYNNFILAESLEKSMPAITENRHFNFISSGPVIEKFALLGPGLIEDDWEGFWYEWETDDVANLEIRIIDTCKITQVTIWNGKEVFAQFYHDSKIFDKSIPIELTKDMHLHVTATNSENCEIRTSYPLYTRNRFYWAHQGSDQMNDYHNVWQPKPKNGSFGIGKDLYEPYGFVTCGFAWGDYLRITSPVPWGDIMPQGIEVSSLVGNFQSLHPSPFINIKESFDFLNNHRRTLGTSDHISHVLYSSSAGSCLENDENKKWIGHGGRSFTPTRIFENSDLWTCEAKYTIPKWEANTPSFVVIEMEIAWLLDFDFTENQSFLPAHSLHFLKEDIGIEICTKIGEVIDDIAIENLLTPLPYADDDTEKEWDNLPVIERMKQDHFSHKSLIIPPHGYAATNGDAMGNYAIFNIDMPGVFSLRAWPMADNRFACGYDFIPEKKKFAKGEVLYLKYAIAVSPGKKEKHEKCFEKIIGFGNKN